MCKPDYTFSQRVKCIGMSILSSLGGAILGYILISGTISLLKLLWRMAQVVVP